MFVCYFLCSPTISLRFVRGFFVVLSGFLLFIVTCLTFLVTFEQVFVFFIFCLFGAIFSLLLFIYLPLSQFKKLAFFLSCIIFSVSLILVAKFCLLSTSSLSIGFLGITTVS